MMLFIPVSHIRHKLNIELHLQISKPNKSDSCLLKTKLIITDLCSDYSYYNRYTSAAVAESGADGWEALGHIRGTNHQCSLVG